VSDVGEHTELVDVLFEYAIDAIEVLLSHSLVNALESRNRIGKIIFEPVWSFGARLTEFPEWGDVCETALDLVGFLENLRAPLFLHSQL
jgi:hypothetical protein